MEKIPSVETITQAAIRLGDQIFTGKNHMEAIMAMEEAVPDWESDESSPEDGFVTSTGRYVDRHEAGQIANKADQLGHLPPDRFRKATDSLDSNWLNNSK